MKHCKPYRVLRALLIAVMITNGCVCLIAQTAIEEGNLDHRVGVSFGDSHYNLLEIDNGLYKASGNQYTYGFSYAIASDRLWVELAGYYTEEDFDLQIFYPDGNYWEPPTMSKSFGALDIGPNLGYDFVQKKHLVLSAKSGFLFSSLTKGKETISGIYGPDYPYYFRGPTRVFESTFSFVLGLGVEVRATKNISVSFNVIYRKFRGEYQYNRSNNDPLINLNAGLNFRFETKRKTTDNNES